MAKSWTAKIIFWGSRGELVAGFLSGVVFGSGSAFFVHHIWGMRDDAPPEFGIALLRGGLKKRELGGVGVGDEAFAGGFGHGGLAGGVEFGFF